VSRELVVLPEAETEMAEAYDWYEARSPGLGLDFLLSVDAVLQAGMRNPR
jgi:toxin ParE1/3/4